MYSSSYGRHSPNISPIKVHSQKRPRQLHLESDPNIIELRDRLIESHDLTDVDNRSLIAVQQSIQQSKPTLFTNSSYVKARELLTLDEEISKEFERRKEEKEKQRQIEFYSNPKLVAHDEETQREMKQMTDRHSKLLE